MKNLRKHIRKALAEAHIDDQGNLVDFNSKTTYPYEEIWSLIRNYYNQNKGHWMKFGWGIFDAHGSEHLMQKYDSESNSVFRVEKIDELQDQPVAVLDYLSSDEEAYEKAKEAGFILDEDGVVLGLNGKNLVN